MEGPRLVIADEPTPGLDAEAAFQVMGHFREMADQGVGVFVITHDLELALQTADRILIFTRELWRRNFRWRRTRREDPLERLPRSIPPLCQTSV